MRVSCFMNFWIDPCIVRIIPRIYTHVQAIDELWRFHVGDIEGYRQRETRSQIPKALTCFYLYIKKNWVSFS